MKPVNQFARGISFHFDYQSEKLVENLSSIQERIFESTRFDPYKIEDIDPPVVGAEETEGKEV